MAELQQPAGRQLHQAATKLADLVEQLAGTVSGSLRTDVLSSVASARQIIAAHEQPMPDLVELAHELSSTMALLEAKIQTRAVQLADEHITAARHDSEAAYAELRHAYRVDEDRWDDLEREMRRQMYGLEKTRARYANALLDAIDQMVTAGAGAGTLDEMRAAIMAARVTARAAAPPSRLYVPDKADTTTSRDRRRANTG